MQRYNYWLILLGLLTLTACLERTRLVTAPTEVKSELIEAGIVEVSWNHSGNALGFGIYRDTVTESGQNRPGLKRQAFEKIGNAEASATSYQDTTVEAGYSYSYQVTALYPTGETDSVVQSNDPVVVNVDIEAPSITLAGPTAPITEAGTISLTATATDNETVTKVAFYRNGTKFAEDTSAPFSADISITDSDNGEHTFSAKAYDASGNVGQSNTLALTVAIELIDTLAPTVSLEASSATVTSAGVLTLTATAEDNVAISKVLLYQNGQVIAELLSAPYTAELELTEEDNGQHTFVAEAIDTAGNRTSSSDVVVEVMIEVADTEAPTVSLSSSSQTVEASSALTLSANAQDNVGVEKVAFYRNGAKVSEDESAPFELVVNLDSSDNGEHIFTAKAFDGAGNVGTSNPVTVTVTIPVPDTTPPQISLSSSTLSATTASTIKLSATASDNVAVSRVEFYKGSTLLASKSSAPFDAFPQLTMADNGTVQFSAKAFDAVGNQATSNTVNVNVAIPIPPTVCQTSETYTVQFSSTWSASTHPQNFPGDPHYSLLIGATHNDNVRFWQTGQLATEGIKNMAERGRNVELRTELNTAKTNGTAENVIEDTANLTTSPASRSLAFPISPSHSQISLVAMIAPSPDWFVGVSGLELCESGTWVNKTVTLYAYDAGTDSGTTYTSPNQETSPAEVIRRITTTPFMVDGVLEPVGTLTFTKNSP